MSDATCPTCGHPRDTSDEGTGGFVPLEQPNGCRGFNWLCGECVGCSDPQIGTFYSGYRDIAEARSDQVEALTHERVALESIRDHFTGESNAKFLDCPMCKESCERILAALDSKEAGR